MKKSIIALAVAASTLGVAQADGTTLYGSARFEYNYTDNNASPLVWGNGQSRSYAGNNMAAGSRFGIKGSDDLGNGMTANYVFEMAVGNGGAVTQRDIYANIAGGFGAVQIGRFTLPYDGVVAYTDIFNGSGALGNSSGGYGLRDFEGFGLPGRVSNVLAYVSPNWSGFSFTAGVVMDGQLANTQFNNAINNGRTWGSGASHVDALQATASYDNNGIHAALGYVKANNATNQVVGGVGFQNDLDAFNLSVGYSNDNFMVGLSAERVDLDLVGTINDRNPTFYNLAGSYNITESDKVYASVGLYDYDLTGVGSPDDALAVGLGYQHNFSAQTRVWAEYQYMDTGWDPVANGVIADEETNTLSLGIRTDF